MPVSRLGPNLDVCTHKVDLLMVICSDPRSIMTVYDAFPWHVLGMYVIGVLKAPDLMLESNQCVSLDPARGFVTTFQESSSTGESKV